VFCIVSRSDVLPMITDTTGSGIAWSPIAQA
jgi:hypothetical protein